MSHSSDNSSAKKLTSPIAITLSNLQGEILKKWVEQVKQQVKSASNLQSPIIINTIPVFLGNLAEAIDGNLKRDSANESNNIAQEHGGERARITDYGPDQVVQEYIILRDIILQMLWARHPLDHQVLSTIQKSFDEAIQKSMMAFYLIYNEVRENVVAHLTHDMRTPLTAAKLSLDLILKILTKPHSTEKNEQIKNLVDRTKKNIDYSNELIENILDEKYLKSYHKESNTRFEPAEMLDIVNSALSGLAEDTRNQIKVAGEKINGYWEKKGIRRLIENLISNAVKYGNEDTPIEVKVSSTSGRVLLSVHNQGNPIPAEERELLFNNFERTAASRKGNQKGWGLGLSYCRQVTTEHAGSLGIESSLENGTTFTIDLPLDPRNIAIKKTNSIEFLPTNENNHR